MTTLLGATVVRFARNLTLVMALIPLWSCGIIVSTLPPSPSPFPTLARLPTVTPITPTRVQTPTSLPTSTVTSIFLIGIVATEAANVRDGPGLNFVVLTKVGAGDEVKLRSRQDDWYQVVTPDQTEGWVSAQVLEVNPEVANAVPLATP
ncbi:MAG: SH3 domain-containing protein [Chloroflexales bacterium]|nr:SH3 domain-containing protein [Chloroflexales bacterium]